MLPRLFKSTDADIDSRLASATTWDVDLWQAVKDDRCSLYIIDPYHPPAIGRNGPVQHPMGLALVNYDQSLPDKTIILVNDVKGETPPQHVFNTGQLNAMLKPPYAPILTTRFDTSMDWKNSVNFDVTPVLLVIRTEESRYKAWRSVLGMASTFVRMM